MQPEEYIESHISPQDSVLHELTRRTHLSVVHPRMLSGHIQGELLTILTKMCNAKRALELGTFTGYSAICIARALPDDGLLDTIEQHEELESIASEFFRKADLDNKIKQYFGPALDIIATLTEPYDIVFIDADKREYPQYYNALFDKALVQKGSVIIADNTLWDGHVYNNPASTDPQTAGIIQFNDMIAADTRVEKVILPLRDGLTIIRVL